MILSNSVRVVVVILATLGSLFGAQFGKIKYVEKRDEITITDYKNASGDVIIPSRIAGKPVTSIGMDAFYGCSRMRSVKLPYGIESIGPSAFVSCNQLKKVTLPDSLENIGNFAFSGCKRLSVIKIPSSNIKFGYEAFGDRLVAFSVKASNRHYSVTDGVLYNRQKTKVVLYPIAKKGTYTFPHGVTEIECSAFQFCRGLTRVTVPAHVVRIGLSAFANCKNLLSIDVDAANPNYLSEEGVLFDKSRKKSSNTLLPVTIKITQFPLESPTSALPRFPFVLNLCVWKFRKVSII